MREGKTTIIDSGTLPTCTRRQKIAGYFEDFGTYSALAFLRWVRHGGNYDEATLVKTLIEACRNLPDRNRSRKSNRPDPFTRRLYRQCHPYRPAPGFGTSGRGQRRSAGARFIYSATGSALAFCRRNRRVVSVEEAIGPYQRNKLYTGEWDTNLAARRVRVRHILTFIAKTFDPPIARALPTTSTLGSMMRWPESTAPAVGERLLVITLMNMARSGRGRIATLPTGGSCPSSCPLPNIC